MGVCFSEHYVSKAEGRHDRDIQAREKMLQLHFWDEVCTPIREYYSGKPRYIYPIPKDEYVLRTSSGCSRRKRPVKR